MSNNFKNAKKRKKSAAFFLYLKSNTPSTRGQDCRTGRKTPYSCVLPWALPALFSRSVRGRGSLFIRSRRYMFPYTFRPLLLINDDAFFLFALFLLHYYYLLLFYFFSFFIIDFFFNLFLVGGAFNLFLLFFFFFIMMCCCCCCISFFVVVLLLFLPPVANVLDPSTLKRLRTGTAFCYSETTYGKRRNYTNTQHAKTKTRRYTSNMSTSSVKTLTADPIFAHGTGRGNMAFTSDGNYALTCGADKKVNVYDVESVSTGKSANATASLECKQGVVGLAYNTELNRVFLCREDRYIVSLPVDEEKISLAKTNALVKSSFTLRFRRSHVP